jgi:hypothetical protein
MSSEQSIEVTNDDTSDLARALMELEKEREAILRE